MPETSKNEDANAEESPVEVWPPRGFSTYYTVTEQIVGQPEISYHFVLPGNFAEVDLATTRIGRHGGPNDEDLHFRGELYSRIGEVAVAAGRVEMAMKRLLLVLTAPTKAHFSTMDHTWTVLVKKLREQCDGSDDPRKQLAEVLDWSEEQGIKAPAGQRRARRLVGLRRMRGTTLEVSPAVRTEPPAWRRSST